MHPDEMVYVQAKQELFRSPLIEGLPG